MGKNYKTYAKEKWLYFAFSIVAYFLPFIIVTACLLPMVKASEGFKLAIGCAIVFINALPFLQGMLEYIFSHYPMINTMAFIYMCISTFFSLDIFQVYRGYFNWIEFAAFVGSLASCILWGKYRKYSKWRESVKANVRSGAFVMKEDKCD